MKLKLSFSSLKLIGIIFLFSGNLHAQSEEKFEFLTYGLPSVNYNWARKVVGEYWNISYKAVAGCEITEELIDSVEYSNKNTYGKVTKEYGEDWEIKFKFEIKGVGNQISGMDRDGFEITLFGIPYPFYEEEFPHHVEAYKNQFG